MACNHLGYATLQRQSCSVGVITDMVVQPGPMGLSVTSKTIKYIQ